MSSYMRLGMRVGPFWVSFPIARMFQGSHRRYRR